MFWDGLVKLGGMVALVVIEHGYVTKLVLGIAPGCYGSSPGSNPEILPRS